MHSSFGLPFDKYLCGEKRRIQVHTSRWRIYIRGMCNMGSSIDKCILRGLLQGILVSHDYLK